MAKNRILRPKTAIDIDKRVERVLRGLGLPEPPLDLAQVRELLNLDRGFYTADDTSLVQESISRIRIATIQVYKRPTLLLDAIRKMSLRALYIPDKKRILLDGTLPLKKHRWNEAHEIGHSLIPWHEDVMLGDNRQTLLPDCHEQVEAEANYAAGRLLFLRDRFEDEARDYAVSLDSVRTLHGTFGNTITTTLWRYIETVGIERPMIGLVSCHPHPDKRPADFDPSNPCKSFIQSCAFAVRFSRLREADVFKAVSGYCSRSGGGGLGGADLILTDDNGDDHVFYFETFFNRYEALTLGIYQKPAFRVLVA